MNSSGPGNGRRAFLINTLKASGQIALTSAGIYSISLIGSGGKFGGMTAGAKCCAGHWGRDGAYCAAAPVPPASRCAEMSVTTSRGTGCVTDWTWFCN